MDIPQMQSGVVDLVALQNAVALLLLSEQRLEPVPVLTEIKLQADNDIAIEALWTLPRAAIQLKPDRIDLFAAVVDTEGGDAAQGPVGAGLLVEMPTLTVISRGVTGPPGRWTIGVVAIEDRNVNLTEGVGTFMMAEQLAQIAVDSLQLQYVYPYGQIAAEGQVVAPARDWESRFPGRVCWRGSLSVENGRIQSVRSPNPVVSFAGGLCTITCLDPAATILYTLDGTPAVRANPSSQQYAAPFAVDSGARVVAGTYNLNGKITSSIIGQTAP